MSLRNVRGNTKCTDLCGIKLYWSLFLVQTFLFHTFLQLFEMAQIRMVFVWQGEPWHRIGYNEAGCGDTNSLTG